MTEPATVPQSAAMADVSPARGQDAPVAAAARFEYLDVLRGFAVMAIFVVNIKGMVMPFSYYINPALWGSDVATHIATLQKFVIDDKWRTIFTALYGAGLVMIAEKSEARGGDAGGRLVKRNLWLIFFGLIHLLFIWVGDILFAYGATGLLAMLFRRMGQAKLFVVGGLILVLGFLWTSLFTVAPVFMEEFRVEMEPLLWGSDPAAIEEEIAAMRGGIADQHLARLTGGLAYILFYVFGGMAALTLGIMLMGMGLFKAGLLRGAWGVKTSLVVAVIGLGGAWTLDALQVQYFHDNGANFTAYSFAAPVGIIDGLLGALGYAALVSALLGAGVRFGPVAAVGRMAFTNYIACSLIGTTLAGGHAWGFGLFGEATLPQLMGVVGITFVAMLIWSPLWLAIFRFGPLEWVWRSLSYQKIQPLFKAR